MSNHIHTRCYSVLALAVIGLVFLFGAVAEAATFHVTTTADNGDNANPTPDSLRKAILDANANPGADTIDFQIPGAGIHTISPPSPLPAISDSVVIDGYTQPGASANTLAVGSNAVLLIELDGTATGSGFDSIGLEIQAGQTPGRGSAAGARNVISGNNGAGINLYGAQNQLVQGNYIGLDVNGAALGNLGAGIVTFNSAQSNIIGGTGAGAGNIIAFNGEGGIVSVGVNDAGNAINGNAIYANTDLSNQSTGLGIDLGGDKVTQNDAGDGDTGPNNLQNFPVITSAISSNNSTTITGTLNSTANTQFRIEFFASVQCDPSGYGEGQIYLGATNVTTVGNDANFNVTLPAPVQSGWFVTATATDPAGNTSEFSQCLILGGLPGQKYGQMTNNADLANALLQTAGVSLPQSDPLLLQLLNNQLTRGQVLRLIVESLQVDQKFFDEAFVIMQYFGYLRRDADALYLNWLATLKQTKDYRVMVNGFVNSLEYRQRHGQ